RESAYQRSEGPVVLLRAAIERMRLIAQRRQRRHDRGRLVAVAPADRNAPGRKIHARMLDSRQRGERPLDLLDAAAAVNAGHRQIDLAQAIADAPASEQDLLAGMAAALVVPDGGNGMVDRRAAGHRKR